MAILRSLPKLEVQICVNNIPLEEYLDDEEDQLPAILGEYRAQRTVSRYVESQTDQEFSIRVTLKPSYPFDSPCLKVYLSVDGTCISTFLFESALDKNGYVYTFNGKHKGEKGVAEALLLPFKFSRLETSANEELLSTLKQDAQRIAQVGEICVEVFRAEEALDTPRTFGNDQFGKDNDLEIHEKALKGQAKSHGVSLGEGRLVDIGQISRRAERLDAYDRPLARFVFKYRSKEALKALLIIERTPSPDASESRRARNVIDLDDPHVERKPRARSFISLVDGEDASGSSSSTRRIKRERDVGGSNNGPSTKRHKQEEIEIVDLTED